MRYIRSHIIERVCDSPVGTIKTTHPTLLPTNGQGISLSKLLEDIGNLKLKIKLKYEGLCEVLLSKEDFSCGIKVDF